MSKILVDVWLYGECARYGNKARLGDAARLSVRLSAGSNIQDLLDYLLICTREFHTLLVNRQWNAMPNHQLNVNYPLRDGDRIDVFDARSAPKFPV